MKKTPLYQAHLRHGGRMVEFAGYALPLQYTSIVEEHLAVRRGAGLFDVSHMGEFLIRGREALAFLQWATANDAAKLKVGRAQYSMLPNARGGGGGRHLPVPARRGGVPHGGERRQHRQGLRSP